MIRYVRMLASTRFTMAGMAVLAVGAALSYGNPMTTPVWVLVVPLSLLGINLLAAILTNPRINQRRPLLIFHIGLLSILVLAAVGRLTHLNAHLELAEGAPFSAQELTDVHAGPLHADGMEDIVFVQGGYHVDYAPGLVRGLTHNQVWVPDDHGGWVERVMGDDRPLIINGYRLYTTYNKGFAPVLTWTATGGAPVTGTVHMPAYPLFEYKQDSTWTPPGGQEIKFWLRLETGIKHDAAWVLDSRHAQGVLVVHAAGQRVELRPGDSVPLPGGVLRYERLASWMGFKVFYDPTLRLLFITAILAILGLAVHFWRRMGALPTADAAPVTAVAPEKQPATRALPDEETA